MEPPHLPLLLKATRRRSRCLMLPLILVASIAAMWGLGPNRISSPTNGAGSGGMRMGRRSSKPLPSGNSRRTPKPSSSSSEISRSLSKSPQRRQGRRSLKEDWLKEGVVKKGIRTKESRVHLVRNTGAIPMISLAMPDYAGAKGGASSNNGPVNHRDLQDLWGIENIRNQMSLVRNKTAENQEFGPPSAAITAASTAEVRKGTIANAGEKELGMWFTKIPKSYVIPEADLVNIFGLPRDFRSHYDLDNHAVLGEGAYGTVFRATRRSNSGSGSNTVAVKVLYKRIHKKKKRRADARYLCRLKNELEMMRQMGKGSHAVGFQEAFEDEDNIYLVMELCRGPTLKHFIRSKGGVSEQDACVMIEQVLSMLASWHEEGYMHCDMKPANLLLTDHDLRRKIHVKATDFGLAHRFAPGTKQHKKQGTKVYMAPEMLKKKYDEKADLWSLGVITYQLLTGHLPFCKHDSEIRRLRPEDLEDRILNYGIDVLSSPTWDNVSTEAKDFILKILERDPAARLSAQEALDHPWIKSFGGQRKAAFAREPKRGKFSPGGGEDEEHELCCEEERIAA